MATSVTDRTWRLSSPDRVEKDLAALWSDLARRAPVSRALMANLVVFRERPATDPIDLTAPIDDVPVDEVSRRHPSRVILLHHERGAFGACIPTAAAVGVLMSGPPQARYGIEQIAVQSACAEASLPSIVRRLALGDVPTSLWWTDDLSERPPLDALVTMGRQLLYDSRCWRSVPRGVLALAPLFSGPKPPDLVDLNWRRLTPMRNALLHAIGSAGLAADMPLADVRIGHRLGDEALAWLLVGWLSARLGSASDPGAMQVTEEQHGTEILSVSFAKEAITATLDDSSVIVMYQGGTAPLVVSAPREEEADAAVAELRSLTDDVCLHDALVALSRRFAAG